MQLLSPGHVDLARRRTTSLVQLNKFKVESFPHPSLRGGTTAHAPVAINKTSSTLSHKAQVSPCRLFPPSETSPPLCVCRMFVSSQRVAQLHAPYAKARKAASHWIGQHHAGAWLHITLLYPASLWMGRAETAQGPVRRPGLMRHSSSSISPGRGGRASADGTRDDPKRTTVTGLPDSLAKSSAGRSPILKNVVTPPRGNSV